MRLAEAPDDWALAAYRLAVASSETAGRPEDLEGALELLDKAARILTADRAPVEHGRILTAAANCHRAAGRADRALELFERAAELTAPRAIGRRARCRADQPRAGALRGRPSRTGDRGSGPSRQPDDRRARATQRHLRPRPRGRWRDPARYLAASVPDGEYGSPDPSRVPGTWVQDQGTGGGESSPDDEAGRLLGAALINRAQARQSLGRDEDVRAALDDYRSAMAVLPASSLQAGMAAHGLGAAVLELCRRGVSGWSADDAVDAFDQSLSVLGHTSFPFHHAVARHSLALAFEMRGEPGDLARALNSAHASLSVFDPRLHAAHWRTAHATLARLEDALGEGDPSAGRLSHVARLLATTDETEREQLLRDRLLRAASLPATGARADLEALIGSVAALPLDDYRDVLRDILGVLMELPDQLLEAACDVLCRVHRELDSTVLLDEALDAVISNRLFGPQRVRVRDLLEANGWVRP